MEDINCWEEKFKDCIYSNKLLDKLLDLNKLLKTPIDIRQVKKAIYYARKYHGSQMRQSGEPYYSHPIEVACIFSDYAFQCSVHLLRTDLLVTCILHDVIEDTKLTKSMIVTIFGDKIADQVEDLTRVKKGEKISSGEILRLLYKKQKSGDVVLIKICDRIHNLQTLGTKSPEKIKQIVSESLREFIISAMYLEMPHLTAELIRLCNYYLSVNLQSSQKEPHRIISEDNSLPFSPTCQNGKDQK